MILEREQAELFTRLEERAVPLMGHLHLTEDCNLACVHCYRAGLPKPAPLDGTEWIRLLDEMKEEGTFEVILTGGEPILHPEWREITRHAARLGFRIDFMTNGTLMTEEEIAFLADCRLRELHISIHGTEAIHDAFTGRPGSFARAWSSVESAARRGLRTVVKMSLLRRTLPAAPALAHLCRTAGAIFGPSYYLIPRFAVSRFATLDQAFLDERLSAEEIRHVEEHHEEWTGRPPFSAELDDCGPRFCSMGWNRFAIGPNGEFHACSQDPVVLDSVRNRPFREIWRHSPALNALRRKKGMLLDECVSCEALARCRFKCMGHFNQATGSYEKPAPAHCAIARAWMEKAA